MKNLSLKICLAIASLFGNVGSGFASDLPDCPSSGYKHNCFGSISVDLGTYVGEWQNGKANGQGKFFFSLDSEWAGDKYVGEYKDNDRQGQGTYTFADGRKYVGQHKDNEANGHGTYTFPNGDKFVGQFRDGERNGQFLGIFANGDKFVGQLRDDNYHGQGTYTFANGNKYVGEFRDGKFNGQGTYTYANGTVEEGIWKDDEFQYAKKLSPPVPVAKTPTQDDEIISASSGSGFASDLPACPSDNKFWHKYFGAYKFEGQGTYVGEWEVNQPHGQGIYWYLDGNVEEGIWKDGEFQYAKKLSPPVPVAKTPTQDDEVISASSGSGFAVSSDGYVITNHHVIDGCQKVVVHTKGKELPVTVVTYDPQNDLALLKGDFRP